MRDTAAAPLGGQHEVEKGQTPAQGMNHVATVTAALPLLVQLCMADDWRGRCNADIASSHGVERGICAVLVSEIRVDQNPGADTMGSGAV